MIKYFQEFSHKRLRKGFLYGIMVEDNFTFLFSHVKMNRGSSENIKSNRESSFSNNREIQTKKEFFHETPHK